MPPNRFRTGYVATAEEGASLQFSRTRAKRWKLHYQPAPEAIRIAKQAHDQFAAPSKPILLIDANPKTDIVVTYPLNTTATSAGFLGPKYGRLRTITLEGFGLSDIEEFSVSDLDHEEATQEDGVRDALQGLPSGFVKDPFFGLGLNYDLRYLIETVEEIRGVTDLHIRRGQRSGPPVVNGISYAVSANVFDEARKAINRIHDNALSIASDEKWAFANNALLTTLDPQKFPEKHRPYRKDAIVEAIGKSLSRSVTLSTADTKAVVAATTVAARSIRGHERGALLELNREIEIVTLEELVTRFKEMLSKTLRESAWQNFFDDNPFILRLAFGIPVMLISGQLSVGGRKFDGSGDKISDFAVKAAASGNLSLVEIKTPATVLVEAKAYRGDLHAPSRELSGAINQVLDRRYQLQKELPALKDSSGIWDVESYAIQGLIIAGRMPMEKPQQKSFELFRNGMKSVMVITFDEFLGKLEHLLEVLRVSQSTTESL